MVLKFFGFLRLFVHFLYLQEKKYGFIPFEMSRGRMGRLRNEKFLGGITMNLKGWRKFCRGITENTSYEERLERGPTLAIFSPSGLMSNSPKSSCTSLTHVARCNF